MSFGIPKNFFPFISDVKVNSDFLEKQRKPTLFDKNLPLGRQKGHIFLYKKILSSCLDYLTLGIKKKLRLNRQMPSTTFR